MKISQDEGLEHWRNGGLAGDKATAIVFAAN